MATPPPPLDLVDDDDSDLTTNVGWSEAPVPLPGRASSHERARLSPSLTAVLPDERQVYDLIQQMLDISGLTCSQVAAKMGIKRESVIQYKIRRRRPSVPWMARFCLATGARLLIELPPTTRHSRSTF
jgi:hypothetical protein